MTARNVSRGSFATSIWRWTAIVGLLAAFFSLGRFTGAAQKQDDHVRLKHVTTDRLEIRNGAGKQVVLFEGQAKDGTVLTFLDKQQRPRLTIGLDAHGAPRIFFIRENHTPSLTISTDSEGSDPAIHLIDDQGNPELSLSITKGFGPGLSIGKVGHARVAVGVSPDGTSSIHLVDQENKQRVAAFVAKDGPALLFYDEKGGLRGEWRLLGDGTPLMSLRDQGSKPRLVVRTDAQGKPLIQVTDPETNTTREIK